MEDGVALFDPDERLTQANTAMEALHGVRAVDWLGAPRSEILAALTAGAGERWARVITRRLQGRTSGVVVAPIGDDRWLRVSRQVIAGVGTIEIHQDITSVIRERRRFARSERVHAAVAQIVERAIARDDRGGFPKWALPIIGQALGAHRLSAHGARRVSAGGLYQDTLAVWPDGEGRDAGDRARARDRIDRDGQSVGSLDPWMMRLARGEVIIGRIAMLSGVARSVADSLGGAGAEAGSVVLAPILAGGVWWGWLTAFRKAGAAPWTAGDGRNIAGLMGALGRLIQRGRREAILSRADARKAALIDGATEGVICCDAQGTVFEFNAAAGGMLGMTRSGALGRPLSVLGGLDEAFDDTGRGEPGVPRRREMALTRADGVRFAASVTSWTTEVEGEPIKAFFIRDISDQRADEAALTAARLRAEAAGEARNAFLNGMSHELRTPLNAIIGFSEMIKEELMGPLGSPHYKEFARDIHDSGKHLLAIINDVLDMSRIQAGDQRLALEPLDIGALVGGCFALLRDRAAEVGVTLVDEGVTGAPMVLADRHAMMKVMVNLVSNGLKFTPPGGRVWVAAFDDVDHGARLVVGDTGVGIEPEALARVFDPFRQGDGGLNRRHEGTGLGLTIVKALMELHGGGVTLDSVPGRGTIVTLTLPALELCAP